MKKAVIVFIYLAFLLLCFACQNQTERVKPLLQKAAYLLEEKPDSALVLLEQITGAEKLKKSLYYDYFLLNIQAKYKNYKDISADTLIFAIRDYYSNKEDVEKTALATFYSGRVYQEQKNYEKALEEFLETEKLLQKNNNLNLKGLCQNAIGDIYSKQFLKEKAVFYYQQAKKYFNEAGEDKNEIITTNLIANGFLIQKKTDSAFIYYNEALDLATKTGEFGLQSSLLMNLGVAYRENGDWERAVKYLNEAINHSKDSLYKARLSANFARMYEQQGNSDSASVNLQRALDYLPRQQNHALAANIYKTWTSFEENKGNYQNALEKYKLYSEHLAKIITENKNAAVLEIEKKYNFQLIENKNKQLQIQRQRTLLLSSTLILILVLLILVSLLRSIKRERELKEAEQKIMQMQLMAQQFNKKENSFRNIFIHHLDILKKTALLEKYLKVDERKKGERLLSKFNEVVYGQKNMDWPVLYQALNKASNNYFDQLEKRLIQLDESEFRICCLIYAEFDNTEIALILNYKVNTVTVKKSAIRKKLGLDNRGDIYDFLKSES